MEDAELRRLIEEGESDRVEFKESLQGDAPKDLREAICAFANDLPGYGMPGAAFVGICDDGSASGFIITDARLRQLADMKTDGNIVPPPSMSVRRLRIGDHTVAAIIVVPSDSPPVRCRGRIHIRIGSRRGIATAQDERILNERRRSWDAPFDVQGINTATLADLDTRYFESEYLTNAIAPDLLDANERSLEERLAAAKMIVSSESVVPTVLGLLVCGKNTRDFIPGAYVQFLKFDGSTPQDSVIDSAEIGGTISDIVRRLEEKLDAHNQTSVDFTSSSREQRDSSYPIVALRQLVRNAIMHRTYESTNAPVHVRWFSDRIEITNPGGPFGVATQENFGQSGIVDYRNPNLAEAMMHLGYVQRFGLGIDTARNHLLSSGHPDLEFTVDQNNVAVSVRDQDPA